MLNQSVRGNMLEVVAFTLVAVVLYLASNRILEAIEVRRGERLAHRTVIFFAILVSMALISFSILERVLGGS